MKNLIFIDNDDKSDSFHEMGLHHTQRVLVRAGFDVDYVSNIKVIDNFSRLSKEEQGAVLFNPQNIVVSYSSYTATHLNSLGQLGSFLRMAGRNDIKGMTYINTTSYLKDAIIGLLRDDKGTYDILQTIATNTIIDTDDKSQLARLTLDFKGRYESPFKLESLDVAELVKDSIIAPRSRERVRPQ